MLTKSLLAGITSVLVLGAPAVAGHSPTHISGIVGQVTDAEATFAGFMLRYVGSPAPDGYDHTYQWGTPYIETAPEAGPVVFDGTIDVTGRANDNSVAMIGLLDKAVLESGQHGYQTGAYLYVNNRANGDVRIGVTDGNVGGEIVQTFVTIPAAEADAGPIAVTFTVDGTADPNTCAVPAGSGVGGEGCMILVVGAHPPISDSYGVITGGPADEFATGAIPGWDAFPSGASSVGYDLTISPASADPQSMDQCKNGGWEAFGFDNQGRCIAFVATGRDSR